MIPWGAQTNHLQNPRGFTPSNFFFTTWLFPSRTCCTPFIIPAIKAGKVDFRGLILANVETILKSAEMKEQGSALFNLDPIFENVSSRGLSQSTPTTTSAKSLEACHPSTAYAPAKLAPNEAATWYHDHDKRVSSEKSTLLIFHDTGWLVGRYW